jgi:hypothetical protein
MSSNIPKQLKVYNSNIHQYVEDYLKGNCKKFPPIGEWDVSEVTNKKKKTKKIN